LEVHITLHGFLRDYLPRQAKGKTTLSLPDGVTIETVLQQLKIKQNAVSAAVGGIQVEADHVLQNGDDLQIFRAIGGG
jgi:sulfur carrier protein ThiS